MIVIVSLNTNISDKSNKMTEIVSDCETSLVVNSCESHIFVVQPAELIDVNCTSNNSHLVEDLSGTFLCKIGSIDSDLADLDATVNKAINASEKQNIPVEMKPLKPFHFK